jgi:hypothetical protein
MRHDMFGEFGRRSSLERSKPSIRDIGNPAFTPEEAPGPMPASRLDGDEAWETAGEVSSRLY